MSLDHLSPSHHVTIDDGSIHSGSQQSFFEIVRVELAEGGSLRVVFESVPKQILPAAANSNGLVSQVFTAQINDLDQRHDVLQSAGSFTSFAGARLRCNLSP